jgi:hypothetical protein
MENFLEMLYVIAEREGWQRSDNGGKAELLGNVADKMMLI